MTVAKQSPPRADARPAMVFRTIAALFLVFCLLGFMAETFGDAFGMVVMIGLLVTMSALLAAPGIALGVLAMTRPAHIGREVRDMGRTSAVMFMIAGAALLVGSFRFASPWALVGGIMLPPIGAWLLARSWMLPPKAFEVKRRFSVPGLLFSVGVVGGLLYASVFVLDLGMGQANRYRVAMKSDLRSIHAIQEEFRDSVGRFGSLRELRAAGWKGSTDVYVAMTADSAAFRGIATHAVLNEECTIWGGRRPGDVRFTADAGEPICRDPNTTVSR